MKKKSLTTIIISIFVTIMITGCDIATDSAYHTRITMDEAVEMMVAYDVIILDVRTLSEFDSGHIPYAISLPIDEIEDTVQGIISNKDQIILVYCRTGNRSDTAAAMLVDMGYRNVYDFGGIVSWVGDIW